MKPLLALALFCASGMASAAPALKVGQPFPIISLPLCGNEAEHESIMDFRGQKLMLHLFASW